MSVWLRAVARDNYENNPKVDKSIPFIEPRLCIFRDTGTSTLLDSAFVQPSAAHFAKDAALCLYSLQLVERVVRKDINKGIEPGQIYIDEKLLTEVGFSLREAAAVVAHEVGHLGRQVRRNVTKVEWAAYRKNMARLPAHTMELDCDEVGAVYGGPAGTEIGNVAAALSLVKSKRYNLGGQIRRKNGTSVTTAALRHNMRLNLDTHPAGVTRVKELGSEAVAACEAYLAEVEALDRPGADGEVLSAAEWEARLAEFSRDFYREEVYKRYGWNLDDTAEASLESDEVSR